MPLHLPPSPVRSLLQKLIKAGLRAVDPYHAILDKVSRAGDVLHVGHRQYNLTHIDRVFAIGAGKASARMAQALEHVLGKRLERGLVVVKTGHTLPTKRITILEASHPIPNQAGVKAAQRLLTLIHNLTPHDLLFVLLSGGASSLLPAPVSGLTLRDKQRTTRLLLHCGATINEINIVRKHLSLIKGGGLIAATRARVATLILSDVIGDDLGSIGSGPTVPDPSTFAEAINVLRRYRIWQTIPAPVRRHLQQGQLGLVPETLKPQRHPSRSVHHQIIGNNRLMTQAVDRAARKAGLRTRQLSTAMEGEAQVVAKQFAHLAKNSEVGQRKRRRPTCIIAGGETTVTVTGGGQGGRAQEFATSAALEIADLPNTWVMAFGTDGTDGPTDAAGAIVSGNTARLAHRKGIDLRKSLQQNNTYPALQKLGCHIHTGPTGTNVNDLYVLLLL